MWRNFQARQQQLYKDENVPAQEEVRHQPLAKKRKTLDKNELLIKAAVCGDWSSVESLLDKGADIDTTCHYQYGRTPLHLVCWEGRHLDILFLLHDRGANMDARDSCDWTPLHCASLRGNLSVVRLLLQKGANQHVTEKLRGRTPLDIAREENHQEIVALLQKHQSVRGMDY